jgi:hypothetical protein
LEEVKRRANNNRDVVSFNLNKTGHENARKSVDWSGFAKMKGLTTNQKSISIGAKGYGEKKVIKSTQGMPWLSEAMKDVISCDKLRVLANMN